MTQTRTITVNGRTGRFDVPSFILTENDDLKILFSFPREIRVGLYRVTIRHGKAPKQVFTLSEDKSVTLSKDWLKAGGTEEIEFALALYNVTGTQVIKDDYEIEPLVIGNAEGNFLFTAELQRLESEVEELKRLLSEEIAVKEEIFAKLKDFADNGAELFPEEIETAEEPKEENENQGE